MSFLKRIMRTVMRQPSCEDVNGFISDYIDGTLDDKTRARFESHLHHCPNCGTFFDQVEITRDVLRSCKDTDVPSELVEHTLQFLRDNR